MDKKYIQIIGMPAAPVITGQPAFIQESTGMRRTSIVLKIDKNTSSEICFETMNTCYQLRIQPPFAGMEVSK